MIENIIDLGGVVYELGKLIVVLVGVVTEGSIMVYLSNLYKM
jgi:hypothetical protein